MHVDRRVLRVSRPVNGWTLTTVAAELLPGFTKSFAQQAMLRRPDGDLCARRVPQLVQTMLDVRLYRAIGEACVPEQPARHPYRATVLGGARLAVRALESGQRRAPATQTSRPTVRPYVGAVAFATVRLFVGS